MCASACCIYQCTLCIYTVYVLCMYSKPAGHEEGETVLPPGGYEYRAEITLTVGT